MPLFFYTIVFPPSFTCFRYSFRIAILFRIHQIKPRVILSMRYVGFRSSAAVAISDGINSDGTRRMSASMLSSARDVKEVDVHEYEIEYGMSPFVFRVSRVDRSANLARLISLRSPCLLRLKSISRISVTNWKRISIISIFINALKIKKKILISRFIDKKQTTTLVENIISIK